MHKAIAFQESAPVANTNASRSHQDAPQLPVLDKALVGSWTCIFFGNHWEKEIREDGSFTDFWLPGPGGPRMTAVRTGHVKNFSDGKF